MNINNFYKYYEYDVIKYVYIWFLKYLSVYVVILWMWLLI